jgi:uncharacterized protein (TIRG00374 family)
MQSAREPLGQPPRTVWRWAFAIGLAAVLLYKALNGVEWSRVWRTVVAARWQYLAGGALISVVSYFLRALRWRILLNAGVTQPLPVRMVFRANMAGYLGNNILPARAGEVIRSLIVSSQSALSRAYVLTTALGERMMDAIVLVLWGSLTLSQVPSKPTWMEGVARTMALVAGAGAVTLTVLPHAGGLVQRVVHRLPFPPALKERLRLMAGQILLALRAFHHVRRFVGFAAFTVAIWSADAASMMVSSRGLGLHMHLAAAVLLLTAMGLGSALPSTPGYVGIYQFVSVTVLGPFGIGRDEALAYSLVTQALGYVVIAILGAPALYRSMPGRIRPVSRSGCI